MATMAKPAQCATRPPQHFLVEVAWWVRFGWWMHWLVCEVKGAISNPRKIGFGAYVSEFHPLRGSS